MGIFSRLNRVIKSNLNALIDQAEDPDKMIGQTVADMKSALKRARKDLIQSLGSAKRLEKKEKDLQQEAADWEQKAILALEREDEDLAKEALRRKSRTLREAQNVRARAAEQATAVDAMKAQLERVEDKLDDLKARQKTLAAQIRRARDQQPDPAQPTGDRLGGTSTTSSQLLKQSSAASYAARWNVSSSGTGSFPPPSKRRKRLQLLGSGRATSRTRCKAAAGR
jgi:phage shock protein A